MSFLDKTGLTRLWAHILSLMETVVPTKVNEAITQAKESGELKGEDGADDHTPVRGTDHQTDADKAEIKAYIDTTILKMMDAGRIIDTQGGDTNE